MLRIGAEKLSGDMTFKRAKFIVTKQGSRYTQQWKGVFQILNELGMVVSWAFTRTQSTPLSQVSRFGHVHDPQYSHTSTQVEEVASRANVLPLEWHTDSCCSERQRIQDVFAKQRNMLQKSCSFCCSLLSLQSDSVNCLWNVGAQSSDALFVPNNDGKIKLY